MMDIIEHISAVSGIDAGVYSSTDIGIVQKIISLTRYLLTTDGQSLPGILTWQYNHPLLYAQVLSEKIYHNLFVKIEVEKVKNSVPGYYYLILMDIQSLLWMVII